MRWRFSNIDLWLRAASHVPGLVNLATQLPGLRDLAKLAGGIPAQRRIPALAPETFKQWWESKPRGATGVHSTCQRQASRPTRPRQPRAPLGRHFQQPLPPLDRQSRRRSSRSRRLRRHRPARPPVLRTPALRRRHARPRQEPAPPDHGRASPGNRSRDAHRRSRTELRLRLPRRTHEPFPQGRTRASSLEASLPAQRISRAAREGFPAPQTARAERSSTDIAITRPS